MMLYRLLSLEKGRFDQAVLSLMDRGSLRKQIEELGIPVYTARMKPGLPTPASLWRFVHLARQLKPDLIQGWLYHGSLAAQVAGLASSGNIPVVWSIHCSLYSLSFEKKLTAAVVRLCALLSRRASSIIFVSRTSRSQHEALGFNLENSCIIRNGIDTGLFASSQASRRSVRKELNVPGNAFLIGMIGRYHEMKDHANFLTAAGKISKHYPDAHFLLAGREVDSDNSALIDLINRLNLAQRTHLLGERTDIDRLLASLDLFCLSSSHGESFPVIVGEAMACEVPCVVTDVGDAAWMVSETGRVVTPRDAAALARACTWMLDLGPEGRRSLGQAARARVLDSFALSSVIAMYDELYETTQRTAAKANSQEVTYSTSGEATGD
jgi:glycosyltransferase involved in cell wall biosynthesis